MLATIALALVGLLIAGVIAMVLVVGWALSENDHAGSDGSIFTVIRRWVADRPKRLSYRRDKKGRFRKVWRG